MPCGRDNNQLYFTKNNITQGTITLSIGSQQQQQARGDNVFYRGTDAFTLCDNAGTKMTWAQFKGEEARRTAGGGSGGGSTME